jgi:hypothetical protein
VTGQFHQPERGWAGFQLWIFACENIFSGSVEDGHRLNFRSVEVRGNGYPPLIFGIIGLARIAPQDIHSK